MFSNINLFINIVLNRLAPGLLEYNVLLPSFLTLLGVWLAARIIRRSYLTTLWSVPGPLLNSFTNLPLKYHTVYGNYHLYTYSLHSTYGPVVRIGYNLVSVSDPSELKTILSTHDFPKGKVYEKMRSLRPNIFSTTDPNLNKLRRRQLGNSYSLPSVRLYEDKVLEHGVLSLIKLWDTQIATLSPENANALVNFYYAFHGMAFDIIGVLAFGKSFEIVSSGNSKIIDSISKTNKLSVIKSGMPFGNHLQWLFSDLVDARRYILTTIWDAIVSRRQENNVENALSGSEHIATHNDLLQRLVLARDPFTGNPIEDESLESELFVLLLGGTGTVSNTLSWVILCLMNCPDVYERLKTEIRTSFPDKSTVIRFDMARNDLAYLTAVIHETMRLYPAVSGFMPRCVPRQGTHILNGKYFLPRGTEIGISLFSCNRNSYTWSNPNTFDPDRFMDPYADDEQKHIADVLSFSSGVRICPGRHLAVVELYTTLANLILRYDFQRIISDRERQHCHYGSAGKLPGKAFFSYMPENPDVSCRILVSHAT